MKNTTIASLLGMTKNQLALLLRVHPTQLSMYMCGQRNLPLKAKLLLSEMLGFVKFEDKGAAVRRLVIVQQEAAKARLERQLRANEDQLYVVGKKLESLEVRYQTNLDAVGVVDYLLAHPTLKEQLDNELLEVIGRQASHTLSKSGLADLTALRLKKEVLELEKLLLASALQKTVRTLEELRA
ncbi:hypothetical protein [Flavobacterium wongokense]|uniref:hypothetical protein n=1 Tax=Flavobacterium wongokense TaxID=2910674 RepID=UPI001F2754D0|nr:hypothetical protein [Flavobacterium sp. WG47]MCF6131707.1 hypothetical protein [Flavobacterium sp. WG47]